MALAIPPKYAYYVSPWLRRLWGRIMPQEYGDDRLIFRLSSDDSIELDKLGDGLAGLARQFERHLRQHNIDPNQFPAKLYVTRLRSRSIEFEVATLLSLLMAAHHAADGLVIWVDFYNRIKDFLFFWAGRAERPAVYTRDDARDFDAFLGTIAGKRGARLNVRRARFRQKTRRRDTIAEFDFVEGDVVNAHMAIGRELTEPPLLLEGQSVRHKTENNMPFIWFRTDRDKAKSSGQTSDRGIIVKITDKPLPVYFASEIENHKDQMTKSRENPFNLVYMVDVAVEYGPDNEPRTYTILNIHRQISGPNQSDEQSDNQKP